jgi:hypothetical protein
VPDTFSHGLAFKVDMITYIHLTIEQALIFSTVVVPIKIGCPVEEIALHD